MSSMKMVLVNDIVYRYAINNPEAVGGAERYEWLQVRALVAAGWSVTVGVYRELAYKETQVIDGVKFVGIGQGNILWAWYRFLRLEQPAWWQWQCASHWLGPAVVVAKLSKVRTIFSAMHDRDIHPRQALTRRPWLWLLYAWGLRRVDKVFVQHGGQFSQLSPKLRSKASILPGVVRQENSASVKPHSQRERYVAWVAVLRKPKRPDLLIEIVRKMPDTRFIVCGGRSPFTSAEYTERIINELRALPNVEYLGHVPPEKTLKIIADAAMLLSTSDGEGFPSVFLESWALGTPVISLTIDPDRVIQEKKLGNLTETVDKCVETIQTLMRTPDIRDEISVRARQHVNEYHSESAITRAFEQGIQSLSV